MVRVECSGLRGKLPAKLAWARQHDALSPNRLGMDRVRYLELDLAVEVALDSDCVEPGLAREPPEHQESSEERRPLLEEQEPVAVVLEASRFVREEQSGKLQRCCMYRDCLLNHNRIRNCRIRRHRSKSDSS